MLRNHRAVRTRPSRAVSRGAAAVLCFTILACSEPGSPTGSGTPSQRDEVRPIPRPNLGKLYSSAPVLQTCGTTVEYPLSNGTHTPGTVTIGNDAERLYVTYSITTPTEAGWYISDTRLAVAKTASGIPKYNGEPDPWSFPYAGEHEPVVKTYSYAVLLRDVGVVAGQTVVVSAMAGAVHPKTANWDGEWEWLVNWALSAGAKMHTYTIASCGGSTPPPPPPAAGGVITITFDDGWRNQYTNAWPVLRDLGLRANLAIYPDAVDGGWTDFMTLAEIRALHDAGWDVVSHSMGHPDLTTVSNAELTRQLTESKNWIAAKGFRQVPIFIVPFHSWGARERTAIQQHYKAARGYTVDQFWPERYTKYPITTPYDLYGFEPEYAPFTTAQGRAETMERVQRAVEQGEYIDLFFHQITNAQLAGFTELMRSVAQYKANVRTFSQIIN